MGQEWVRKRGTQGRQQTRGGATQTHRTREPHQEGQGRAQQRRRRGATSQKRQPQQREQGNRREGMGERAHGRQRQQRGWPGQPAPSLPGARATPAQPASGRGCLPQPRWAVCATGAGAHQGQTSHGGGEGTYGGRPGQRMEEQGTWAACTQKHSKVGYGRPVDRGAWTAKTIKRPRQQPAHPQCANYWAPLTRKRHILPHSAQPQHTNHWAPRPRKRHQQEHRPQRPTERSDPTQHAKGRTGDCPGPRKGATTRRNVTQGGAGNCSRSPAPHTLTPEQASTIQSAWHWTPIAPRSRRPALTSYSLPPGPGFARQNLTPKTAFPTAGNPLLKPSLSLSSASEGGKGGGGLLFAKWGAVQGMA